MMSLRLAVACMSLWACGGTDAGLSSDRGGDGGGDPPDLASADLSGVDATVMVDLSSAVRDASPPDLYGTGPGPGPTQTCTITKDTNGFFKLTSTKSDYIARLPASYSVSNPQPTRLVVSLHGCGDTALNHATWAAVPYALRNTQDYIAISVGGRDGSCWTVPADSAIVDAAIQHVRSCFYVHQKKIVLAGYSSGGDLTYSMSMTQAARWAGILIEHSDLTQNVGASKVDSVLAGAAWKLNVSIRAGDNDTIYPIATVKSDFNKMVAAGFPAELVETADTHSGTSTDWEALLSKMGTWQAP